MLAVVYKESFAPPGTYYPGDDRNMRSVNVFKEFDSSEEAIEWVEKNQNIVKDYMIIDYRNVSVKNRITLE